MVLETIGDSLPEWKFQTRMSTGLFEALISSNQAVLKLMSSAKATMLST